MAINTEIKDIMSKEGVLFDVAEKIEYKRELNAEEKEIAEISDAWAREIGKTGKDPECTIAEFINRTVNEEIYNAPDELLDQIFERGSVGEFDDYEGHKDPKNTLVAYEAARGGNVDRSYIDISVLKPTWKNRQVETDLSYTDLRKNGFKSIATLTTFMKEACQNALFFDALALADEAVTGGEQLIAVSGATPTLEAMDKLSLYLNDRASDSVIITLNNQKLIDRKNELIDAQQQAILSAEDEKDSIKDLIQDGIDKQLDALDDLIDKYLDCLDSEKSLYEYRKKIGEQSEKIASLQKQLSSLQGDNSEENKAKLQKLKEDLKSAQDDMEETQYDKYISDQKKLLDELKQDYKKALDDRMDNVDVLISDAIASINSNSSNISQTLQTESKNVGYTLSGEMQTIWTSQSGIISQYGDDFSSKLTGVNSAIENVYNRQKDMIDAINAMAEKWIAKADQMLQQPTKTEGVLEEVEQKPDKDNVAEGNPTPDPPKVSDKDSIKDAVLVDPDEPKKKPNKTNETKTGNGKAEVGDKVTFSSGRYYEASDGSGASGNMYLGKKVKITRINKGSKYPYAIDATDGTELGWVKLNQLKGYASGIMRVPNDQLAWTQEQGEEAIVRNDGSILTPLSRDVSVLNADMTKNLWDFMGNPGSFLSDYSDGEKFGVKNVDNSSSVDVGGVTIQCNMPNVQNANDLLHELTTNKDIEKAICAMTIGRAMSGSSLAKYKYKK